MSGSNSSAPDAGSASALQAEAAEPLTMTVHSLPAATAAGARDPAAQRRTTSGRVKMLLVLLVCAAPVIASYFTYFVIRPEGRTNYGSLIQPSRSMPAGLALTSLDGRPVAAPTLRGQWLLVTVGPAACDAACEKRLYQQRQLREMLGRERTRLDKIWFVTDGGQPAEALARGIDAPGMQVLRAQRSALAAWLEPAAGQLLEDHLYVVDPMGEWILRMPPDAEPARIKRDLERLLRASASWDTPGR
jgi:hypothetical protein